MLAAKGLRQRCDTLTNPRSSILTRHRIPATPHVADRAKRLRKTRPTLIVCLRHLHPLARRGAQLEPRHAADDPLDSPIRVLASPRWRVMRRKSTSAATRCFCAAPSSGFLITPADSLAGWTIGTCLGCNRPGAIVFPTKEAACIRTAEINGIPFLEAVQDKPLGRLGCIRKGSPPSNCAQGGWTPDCPVGVPYGYSGCQLI